MVVAYEVGTGNSALSGIIQDTPETVRSMFVDGNPETLAHNRTYTNRRKKNERTNGYIKEIAKKRPESIINSI